MSPEDLIQSLESLEIDKNKIELKQSHIKTKLIEYLRDGGENEIKIGGVRAKIKIKEKRKRKPTDISSEGLTILSDSIDAVKQKNISKELTEIYFLESELLKLRARLNRIIFDSEVLDLELERVKLQREIKETTPTEDLRLEVTYSKDILSCIETCKLEAILKEGEKLKSKVGKAITISLIKTFLCDFFAEKFGGLTLEESWDRYKEIHIEKYAS